MQRGNVLSFKYNGGTHPGAYRCVYVLEDKPRSLFGYDFDAKEVRNFTHSKIDKKQLVPTSYIALGSLPASVDPETLVSGFNDDGKEAFYDSQLKTVASFKRPTLAGLKVSRHESMGREYTCISKESGEVILGIWDNGHIYCQGRPITTQKEFLDNIKTVIR